MSGILASTLARGANVLAPIITVPIALSALGVDGYGAWASALGLTGFAAFADLGLGSGLMTTLPKALVDGDMRRARELVSAAYVVLGVLSALVIAALCALSSVVDWAALVGAGTDSSGASAIVLVTLVAFGANIVAGLIVRVQQAAQQVTRSYLWQTIAAVAGILAVVVAARFGATAGAYVAAAAFTPVVVSLINTVVFFAAPARVYLRPSSRAFKFSTARELMGVGGQFLVIFLLMSAALGTDAWIVATAGSLADAAAYAVPSRIFAAVGALVAAVATPLWPISAHAIASGDIAWARRATVRLSIFLPLLVGALSSIAVLLAPAVFTWWLRGALAPGMLLLVGLAIFNTVQAVVSPIFMIQNASRVLWPQTLGYAALFLALPLKWFVVSLASYEWLPMLSSALYIFFVWPAAFLGYRMALRAHLPKRAITSGKTGLR